MNPSPEGLAFWTSVHEQERRRKAEHQARLHKAAVERRRKAKRGGRR